MSLSIKVILIRTNLSKNKWNLCFGLDVSNKGVPLFWCEKSVVLNVEKEEESNKIANGLQLLLQSSPMVQKLWKECSS